MKQVSLRGLAEAFHHLAKQSRYDYVNKHCRFGASVQGRDEIAAKKTLSAMIKLLHPVGEPTRNELEEYMAYALEGRRRVKEQLNKRKADDEYEAIHLAFVREDGSEFVVWCPESKHAEATQHPVRRRLPGSPEIERTEPPVQKSEEKKPDNVAAHQPESGPEVIDQVSGELQEQHYTIFYGDTGYTYERMFGAYLKGAKKIYIKDPYIRANHQIANLVRFCELAVKIGDVKAIHLETGFDDDTQKVDTVSKFTTIESSLKDHDVIFTYSFHEVSHDREIRLDNRWIIKIGRGFDFYQKPDDWYAIGATDLYLRPCLETMVDIFKA